MRRSLWIGVVLAAGMFLAVGSAPAAEAPTEPTAVTNFGDKAPVVFDHAKHGEVTCVTCHHNEADGNYKCGACHALAAAGDTPKIKDAFHKKGVGVCYDCHFGKEPQAKKLKCGECHVK